MLKDTKKNYKSISILNWDIKWQNGFLKSKHWTSGNSIQAVYIEGPRFII